jgi:methylmalonyl-CoA/ethylmalonyl-CoA epimerase
MSVKAKGLDHVAIAVKDLDKAISIYRDALGLELAEIEDVPEQHVRTAIFGHGMGRVELICPTDADNGVARFLEKRGEGLHHVCIEVEDIDAALAALKARARRSSTRRRRSAQAGPASPSSTRRAPPGCSRSCGRGRRRSNTEPARGTDFR